MGEGKVVTDASALLYVEVGSLGSVPAGFEELFVDRLTAIRVSERGVLIPKSDENDPFFKPYINPPGVQQLYSASDVAYNSALFLHNRRDVILSRFFNTRELRRPLQIFRNFGDIGLVALDFSGTTKAETDDQCEREIKSAGHNDTIKLVRALSNSYFMHSSSEKPDEDEGLDLVIELDGAKQPEELVEEVHYRLDERHLIPQRAGEG
jgi:hypothetical protein